MPTIDDYNGIPMEQHSDTNYSYNVGGEIKKTVPFTKELREWLLSFIGIGLRVVTTIDDIRLFEKYKVGQAILIIENGGIYQFQNVTTADDGELFLKPENVHSTDYGRWVQVLKIGESQGGGMTFEDLVAILQEGTNVTLDVDEDEETITLNSITNVQNAEDVDNTEIGDDKILVSKEVEPGVFNHEYKPISFFVPPIPMDRTVWINEDITADDPSNRIFKTYASAVTWITDNGSPSSSNRWLIKANVLSSITLYNNIVVHAVSVSAVINGRDNLMATARFDEIKYIGAYNINSESSYVYFSTIDNFSGTGVLRGYLCSITNMKSASGRQLFFYDCNIRNIDQQHATNNGIINSTIGGYTSSTFIMSAGILLMHKCFLTDKTMTGGVMELRGCQGNITQSGGTLNTFNHQGTITRTGGTWTNEGAVLNAEGFDGNLDETVTDTQELAEKVNKLRFASHADSPTVDNVGLLRYRKDGNNTYCEMVMQTEEDTYEWIVIKENNW